MTRYADKTKVSPEKSRIEIERTLARYGADGFMYGTTGSAALVMFRMNDRHIKFILPLPTIDDFAVDALGRSRSSSSARGTLDQAVRQRWRALSLVIKAKLEAVESGVAEFEEEFLAHIVLPDGKTVGDFMIPQVRAAYVSGKMPPLLPDLRGEK